MSSDKLMFRLLRYAGAGGLSLVVYYAVYISLIKVFEVWYVLASMAAFVCYISINFTLQKYWTFRDKDQSRFWRQLRRHLLLHSINQVINIAGLIALIDYAGLGEVTAQGILSAYFTIENWLISNYWIFRKRES